MKGRIFKFNDLSMFTFEQLKATPVYKLMERLENGERVKTDELSTFFSELWHSSAYRSGVVRIMGWQLDFAPYFHRYLVKYKYDGWREVVAYNKTAVRNLCSFPSHVLEIISHENIRRAS